jgi:hypothetical protein
LDSAILGDKTMLENSGTTDTFDEHLRSTTDHREFSGMNGGMDEQGTEGKTEVIFDSEDQYETDASPVNVGNEYNLFLSYAWGKGNETHEKVKILADLLIEQGERPFLDSNNLRGNMRGKISKVLASSPIFVTILTKEYNEKVKSEKFKDYCFFELNFGTKKCEQRILVILDESMRDTEMWCDRLQSEFANILYIDLSGIDNWKDTNNHSFDLFTEEVRRLLAEK